MCNNCLVCQTAVDISSAHCSEGMKKETPTEPSPVQDDMFLEQKKTFCGTSSQESPLLPIKDVVEAMRKLKKKLKLIKRESSRAEDSVSSEPLQKDACDNSPSSRKLERPSDSLEGSEKKEETQFSQHSDYDQGFAQLLKGKTELKAEELEGGGMQREESKENLCVSFQSEELVEQPLLPIRKHVREETNISSSNCEEKNSCVKENLKSAHKKSCPTGFEGSRLQISQALADSPSTTELGISAGGNNVLTKVGSGSSSISSTLLSNDNIILSDFQDGVNKKKNLEQKSQTQSRDSESGTELPSFSSNKQQETTADELVDKSDGVTGTEDMPLKVKLSSLDGTYQPERGSELIGSAPVISATSQHELKKKLKQLKRLHSSNGVSRNEINSGQSHFVENSGSSAGLSSLAKKQKTETINNSIPPKKSWGNTLSDMPCVTKTTGLSRNKDTSLLKHSHKNRTLGSHQVDQEMRSDLAMELEARPSQDSSPRLEKKLKHQTKKLLKIGHMIYEDNAAQISTEDMSTNETSNSGSYLSEDSKCKSKKKLKHSNIDSDPKETQFHQPTDFDTRLSANSSCLKKSSSFKPEDVHQETPCQESVDLQSSVSLPGEDSSLRQMKNLKHLKPMQLKTGQTVHSDRAAQIIPKSIANAIDCGPEYSAGSEYKPKTEQKLLKDDNMVSNPNSDKAQLHPPAGTKSSARLSGHSSWKQKMWKRLKKSQSFNPENLCKTSSQQTPYQENTDHPSSTSCHSFHKQMKKSLKLLKSHSYDLGKTHQENSNVACEKVSTDETVSGHPIPCVTGIGASGRKTFQNSCLEERFEVLVSDQGSGHACKQDPCSSLTPLQSQGASPKIYPVPVLIGGSCTYPVPVAPTVFWSEQQHSQASASSINDPPTWSMQIEREVHSEHGAGFEVRSHKQEEKTKKKSCTKDVVDWFTDILEKKKKRPTSQSVCKKHPLDLSKPETPTTTATRTTATRHDSKQKPLNSWKRSPVQKRRERLIKCVISPKKRRIPPQSQRKTVGAPESVHTNQDSCTSRWSGQTQRQKDSGEEGGSSLSRSHSEKSTQNPPKTSELVTENLMVSKHGSQKTYKRTSDADKNISNENSSAGFKVGSLESVCKKHPTDLSNPKTTTNTTTRPKHSLHYRKKKPSSSLKCSPVQKRRERLLKCIVSPKKRQIPPQSQRKTDGVPEQGSCTSQRINQRQRDSGEERGSSLSRSQCDRLTQNPPKTSELVTEKMRVSQLGSQKTKERTSGTDEKISSKNSNHENYIGKDRHSVQLADSLNVANDKKKENHKFTADKVVTAKKSQSNSDSQSWHKSDSFARLGRDSEVKRSLCDKGGGGNAEDKMQTHKQSVDKADGKRKIWSQTTVKSPHRYGNQKGLVGCEMQRGFFSKHKKYGMSSPKKTRKCSRCGTSRSDKDQAGTGDRKAFCQCRFDSTGRKPKERKLGMLPQMPSLSYSHTHKNKNQNMHTEKTSHGSNRSKHPKNGDHNTSRHSSRFNLKHLDLSTEQNLGASAPSVVSNPTNPVDLGSLVDSSTYQEEVDTVRDRIGFWHDSWPRSDEKTVGPSAGLVELDEQEDCAATHESAKGQGDAQKRNGLDELQNHTFLNALNQSTNPSVICTKVHEESALEIVTSKSSECQSTQSAMSVPEACQSSGSLTNEPGSSMPQNYAAQTKCVPEELDGEYSTTTESVCVQKPDSTSQVAHFSSSPIVDTATPSVCCVQEEDGAVSSTGTALSCAASLEFTGSHPIPAKESARSSIFSNSVSESNAVPLMDTAGSSTISNKPSGELSAVFVKDSSAAASEPSKGRAISQTLTKSQESSARSSVESVIIHKPTRDLIDKITGEIIDKITRELKLIDKCLQLLKIPGMDSHDSSVKIDALAEVVRDFETAVKSLQQHCEGRPHMRLPSDLLLPSERDKLYTEDGSFIILLSCIPRASYIKLREMKECIESCVNEQTDCNQLPQQRDTSQQLRVQRSDLIQRFTGFVTAERLKKIEETYERYSVCQKYVLQFLGQGYAAKMTFFKAYFEAICNHARVVREEMAKKVSR